MRMLLAILLFSGVVFSLRAQQHWEVGISASAVHVLGEMSSARPGSGVVSGIDLAAFRPQARVFVNYRLLPRIRVGGSVSSTFLAAGQPLNNFLSGATGPVDFRNFLYGLSGHTEITLASWNDIGKGSKRSMDRWLYVSPAVGFFRHSPDISGPDLIRAEVVAIAEYAGCASLAVGAVHRHTKRHVLGLAAFVTLTSTDRLDFWEGFADGRNHRMMDSFIGLRAHYAFALRSRLNQ